MSPGIHLVHKPVGPTSFSLVKDAIASLTSSPGPARTPAVCHGGTLDPFACGLLLLLVGPATKLFDHLHAVPKVYDATLLWGVETDNGDPLGRVVGRADPSGLSAGQLDEALRAFVGWREQVPPPTSAKRVGGERAYVRAHRGETFELPPSRVYLHDAAWLDHDLPTRSRLRIVVRGGYYVRSLARDLGRLLGCGAHLGALHRTAIGPWNDPGLDRRVALSGRDLLPWAASRVLNDQEVGALRAGRTIRPGQSITPDCALPAGFPDPEAPVRGFHLGKLAFLLRTEGQTTRAVTEFRPGL